MTTDNGQLTTDRLAVCDHPDGVCSLLSVVCCPSLRQGQSLKLGDIAFRVFAKQYLLHLGHHLGVLSGNIMVFVQVGGEVVESAVTSVYHKFPVAHAQGHHIGFMELPIEEVVLLLSALAQ